MLRAYFMHHRELLSDLARLAYETIQELMSEAVDDKDVRPGVVAVPQTFGSLINPHPHVHCLASRGVWDAQGRWLPVPYIDTAVAENLFRHKTLLLLKRRDLLSDERIELLSSFHRSGFSVDDSPTVWPQDTDGLERLARYLLRCPLSLSRVHWTEGARTIFYQGKSSHDDPFATDPQGETLDVFEFLARVLTQIPEPRRHGMHYLGAYSSRARARRKAQGLKLVATPTDRDKPASSDEPKPSSSERAALRRRWANLIKRVFKTDPLLCECGEKFRIISFITEPKVIRKILDHLQKRQPSSRAPPRNDSPLRSQPS